jgi:hypothetical protein
MCTDTIHDKITELYAESIFNLYKQKRYGLKSCSVNNNPERIQDIKELYIRLSEMEECGHFSSECGAYSCKKSKVEEVIKTL